MLIQLTYNTLQKLLHLVFCIDLIILYRFIKTINLFWSICTEGMSKILSCIYQYGMFRIYSVLYNKISLYIIHIQNRILRI